MGFVYLRFKFSQLNPREFISVANLTTWYCACYLFKLKSLLFFKDSGQYLPRSYLWLQTQMIIIMRYFREKKLLRILFKVQVPK